MAEVDDGKDDTGMSDDVKLLMSTSSSKRNRQRPCSDWHAVVVMQVVVVVADADIDVDDPQCLTHESFCAVTVADGVGMGNKPAAAIADAAVAPLVVVLLVVAISAAAVDDGDEGGDGDCCRGACVCHAAAEVQQATGESSSCFGVLSLCLPPPGEAHKDDDERDRNSGTGAGAGV